MGDQIEVVAGSYEQIVFGYRVCSGKKEWRIEPVFTHHAHTACLSALATSEQFIATGSKDESIQLYNMKTRTEHGALFHHEGTVSCLEFFGTSHLLSGGEDGCLCVWSTKTWECLKSFRAHEGYVTSVSVHPSGKLALSVGTDMKLRTWNLIDGRSAFIKNIRQNAHLVMWSPDGDKYVVAVHDKLEIYSLDSASVTGMLTFRKRISSVRFLKNTLLAVAGDEEHVQLYDLISVKCVCEFRAHDNRVKAMTSLMMDDVCVLVTASNDGFIKFWKITEEEPEVVCLLGQTNTSARLTCLSVWRPISGKEASAEEITQPAEMLSADKESLLSPMNKRLRISTEEVILEEDFSRMQTKNKKRRCIINIAVKK